MSLNLLGYLKAFKGLKCKMALDASIFFILHKPQDQGCNQLIFLKTARYFRGQ